MDDADAPRDGAFPAARAPYHDHLGVRVAEWRDGYARLVCDTAGHHANRSGIVHGGVLLAMADQAAAFAGLFCAAPGRVRRAVTLDLDCRFTGQAAVGGRLTAEGRVVAAGRNVFFARAEVRDAAGALVAFAASTHRYRAGSADPAGVPDDGGDAAGAGAASAAGQGAAAAAPVGPPAAGP